MSGLTTGTKYRTGRLISSLFGWSHVGSKVPLDKRVARRHAANRVAKQSRKANRG